MPLTAVLDGHPTYVFDHDAPTLAAIASGVRCSQRSLRCKDCAHPMTVVMPARRLWHFRHLPKAPATCRFINAHESDEHRAVKRRVYDMCRERGWEAEVEWHVPGTGRRADVWTRDHLGRQFTFEVQLSNIPDETCYARSVDHLSAGITPVWLIEGDLRYWAFPDGAKRVRMHRNETDNWVFTGLGEYVAGGGTSPASIHDRRHRSRKARRVSRRTLLALLDAPTPLPSTSRPASRTPAPPGQARRPLELNARPAGPRRTARDDVAVIRPIITRRPQWRQVAVMKREDSPRANPDRGHDGRPAHIDVIKRLRSLAEEIAGRGLGDSARYRRIAAMPATMWTKQHLVSAIAAVWAYRDWLWARGSKPICTDCGLSLDPDLLQNERHLARCWVAYLLSSTTAE